jgi:hypothetical protein
MRQTCERRLEYDGFTPAQAESRVAAAGISVSMGFSTSISRGSPHAWSRVRRLHIGVCSHLSGTQSCWRIRDAKGDLAGSTSRGRCGGAGKNQGDDDPAETCHEDPILFVGAESRAALLYVCRTPRKGFPLPALKVGVHLDIKVAELPIAAKRRNHPGGSDIASERSRGAGRGRRMVNRSPYPETSTGT